jgi:cytoskeletal protein CcmA (bactofilin family)
VGDIKTARIIIEDGAYFKGSIDIVKADAPKQAQAKPQQVAASAGSNYAQPTPVASNVK